PGDRAGADGSRDGADPRPRRRWVRQARGGEQGTAGDRPAGDQPAPRRVEEGATVGGAPPHREGAGTGRCHGLAGSAGGRQEIRRFHRNNYPGTGDGGEKVTNHLSSPGRRSICFSNSAISCLLNVTPLL